MKIGDTRHKKSRVGTYSTYLRLSGVWADPYYGLLGGKWANAGITRALGLSFGL